jgi:hypothetical protein
MTPTPPASTGLYAMLVTKDDADVVVEIVDHALGFCDKIIQLDNCSTDGTWERVGELAIAHPDRIVQLRQFDESFYDGIRAEIYNAFRAELGDGWWLMLAPDEFLVGDPRPMLADAAASGADAVMCWMAQFVFTDRDRRRWEDGLVDPNEPIGRRVRSYRVDWREFRLFRNDPELEWDDPDLYLPRPESTWTLHRTQGMILHYQFRSPDQIRRRIELRYGRFPHVTSPEWTDYVKPWWKYSIYRGGAIRTSGFWYYARRIRQRVEMKLGRRAPSGGIPKAS